MESMTYFGQKNDPFFLNINNKEIDKEKINIIDKNKENENEYVSSLSSQYKNEISVLKNYIQKMNLLVRKNLNMEILPSLEEGFDFFSNKIRNGSQQDEIRETIREWLNKLLNVDYINPLISLYENYIKNLEEELKNCKTINKKYENIIMKIVNENNELRNQIQLSEEELKNFLEVRNECGDGSSLIVMDREYMTKLEERNQLLSKENEILVVNYNKLNNELMQIKSDNAYKGSEQNNIKYQQLYQQFFNIKKEKDILQEQYNIDYQQYKKRIDQLQEDNAKLKLGFESSTKEAETLKKNLNNINKLAGEENKFNK